MNQKSVTNMNQSSTKFANFGKPSSQQNHQIYRKDKSSAVVLVKTAFLTNFQEKICSEGKSLLLDTYISFFVTQGETEQKLLKTQIQMPPTHNLSLPLPKAYKKHRENCEKLHQEHLIGCRGVKLFLLKDFTITTVATATVTTVTINTVTI